MNVVVKNEVMPFEHEAFGQVRVVMDESTGEPWFVAKDVCDALGLTNVGEAVKPLDDDEKAAIRIPDVSYLGVTQLRRMVTVSEPGIYALIVRSHKPEAKAFSRWVRHEVLPTIRKTGGYLMASKDETPDAIMARAILVAQNTLKRIEEEKLAAVERAAELERTKAHISSKREATCMATASAAVRKLKKLEAQVAPPDNDLPLPLSFWDKFLSACIPPLYYHRFPPCRAGLSTSQQSIKKRSRAGVSPAAADPRH